MPEPFKNAFNSEMIALMARHFKRAWSDFDEAAFIMEATDGLDALELKARSNQIERALEAHLPADFSRAAPILLAALHPDDDIDLSGTDMDEKGIRGWAIMPMTHYVGVRGIENFDLGMDVQKELTKRFSSEFGIRSFIEKDQLRALSTLTAWAEDVNFHVRRLVSEGARPRLPWASRLPKLIEDPEPLFPILERLKDDPVEYVRRSVANCLNDISKDHPDKIAQLAGQWMQDATAERMKLVRHACRSLIKRGHPEALSALGYQKPQASSVQIDVMTPEVRFGDGLHFGVSLISESSSDQNIILDYVIHHKKANGKTSPKVFKWKTFVLKGGERFNAVRKHPIKPITTRKYYPGTHRVEIQLNGANFGDSTFELVMA